MNTELNEKVNEMSNKFDELVEVLNSEESHILWGRIYVDKKFIITEAINHNLIYNYIDLIIRDLIDTKNITEDDHSKINIYLNKLDRKVSDILWLIPNDDVKVVELLNSVLMNNYKFSYNKKAIFEYYKKELINELKNESLA